MYRYVLLWFLLMPGLCFAQGLQDVRGRIIDKDSKSPLQGAIAGLTDFTTPIGSASDKDGYFVIENVPVGRHTLSVNLQGYRSVTITDVLVISGRETVLEVGMEETVTTSGEVAVSHERVPGNSMALVSAQPFDQAEADLYPGSRNDPARMAMNFSGVQGWDDSRNDVIIRGNSPQSVLWRMEGVDIPNPNHFAIPGTMGGPESIINSNTLGNSDLLMSAFPAEYGDAVGGVFDLKLRDGNVDKDEFTAQLGVLGAEAMAEGPMWRDNGSSFLVAYRYSTLQLAQNLNIKSGSPTIPDYQDLTFKLNYPVSKRSTVSVFGVGGLSNTDLGGSDLLQPTIQQQYVPNDHEQQFISNTGVIGVTYSHIIDQDTYTKLTIAETGCDAMSSQNYIFRDLTTQAIDSVKPVLGYNYLTKTTVAHWNFTKKLSSRQTIEVGAINNLYSISYIDSSRQYPPTNQNWLNRENFYGTTDLIQAYLEYKYRLSEAVVFTAGLHGQYLTHNKAQSVEPRIGLKMIITDYDVVTLGYGLHSEMLPLYQYFSRDTATGALLNYNTGFMRSQHVVAGYDRTLGENTNIHLEAYYQYLFDVPVENVAGSSYSALDQGTGYALVFPGQLQNTGTGYNYGVDVTFKKAFSRGYYLLFTGTVFNSEAKGNDGVYRSTDYNNHYDLSLLAGYEQRLDRKKIFIAGLKVAMKGGEPYSPLDTAASNRYGELVVISNERNSLHFSPSIRADVKLALQIDRGKLTHEIGLDVVNVFNTENALMQGYSYELSQETGGKEPFYNVYQPGILPILYYRIDF